MLAARPKSTDAKSIECVVRRRLRAKNIWRRNQSRKKRATDTFIAPKNHAYDQDRRCAYWLHRIRYNSHSCVACAWKLHSLYGFILLLFLFCRTFSTLISAFIFISLHICLHVWHRIRRTERRRTAHGPAMKKRSKPTNQHYRLYRYQTPRNTKRMKTKQNLFGQIQNLFSPNHVPCTLTPLSLRHTHTHSQAFCVFVSLPNASFVFIKKFVYFSWALLSACFVCLCLTRESKT